MMPKSMITMATGRHKSKNACTKLQSVKVETFINDDNGDSVQE